MGIGIDAINLAGLALEVVGPRRHGTGAGAADAGMVVIGRDVAPPAIQRATEDGVGVVAIEDLLRGVGCAVLALPADSSHYRAALRGSHRADEPPAFVVDTAPGE